MVVAGSILNFSEFFNLSMGGVMHFRQMFMVYMFSMALSTQSSAQSNIPDQDSLERLFVNIENSFEVANPVKASSFKKDFIRTTDGDCVMRHLFPIVNRIDLFSVPYFFAGFDVQEDKAVLFLMKKKMGFVFAAGFDPGFRSQAEAGTPQSGFFKFSGPAEKNANGDLTQRIILKPKRADDMATLYEQSIDAVLRRGEFDGRTALLYSADYTVKRIKEGIYDEDFKKKDQRVVMQRKLLCQFPETFVDL